MSQRGAFASRNPLVAAQAKRDGAHGRSDPAPSSSKRASGADVRPHLTATRNTMLTGVRSPLRSVQLCVKNVTGWGLTSCAACAQGIPVREGLQTTHKVVRDKTIREAIVFVLYTCLFLGILYVPHMLCGCVAVCVWRATRSGLWVHGLVGMHVQVRGERRASVV